MFTLKEISESLAMTFQGDGNIQISGPSEPKTALVHQLALAMDKKFLEDLKESKARVALLIEGTEWKKLGLDGVLFVNKPRYALARLNNLFEESDFEWEGIHNGAIISQTANIADKVAIGPFSVVGQHVVVKENSKIGSHVFIGKGSTIGKGAIIHSGVKIGANVVIGDGFICHANAVIGSDGFSFVSPDGSNIRKIGNDETKTSVPKADRYVRIASLGSVVIGNDVEIGAGSIIDRGTITNTKVGNGTKLDNLVHVAHNVSIGENCLLCGQVGIAGSAKIGDRVVLGGQVGVADHIAIGSDSVIAGKSGVSSNVPKGRFMMGNPAIKIENNIESYKLFRRLPKIVKKVEYLQQVILKNS